jgi:hypothetical protein
MADIRLRIKPADVRRVDLAPIRGDEEEWQLVNLGGRTLEAHETPEPYGILRPGDEFLAPKAWYASRKHWKTLEVVPAGSEAPVTVNVDAPDQTGELVESYADLRAALADQNHNRLGKELKAVGLPVPATKAERIEAATEFLESR